MSEGPSTLVAIVLSAGAAAAAKVVGEQISAYATKRWLKKTKEIGPTDISTPPGPPPVPPLARVPAFSGPTVEMYLLAKEVELVRMRQELREAQAALVRLRQENDGLRHEQATQWATAKQLGDAQESLRRLRGSADAAAFEQARLSGELTLQRQLNEQLMHEMTELRKGDGSPSRGTSLRVHNQVDPQFAVERVRAPDVVKPGMSPRKGTKPGQ